MAKLMKMLQPLQSEYVDRRFDGSKDEYFKQLEMSSTLYIGNLSFFTTDDQIYELFGKVGVVQRVIMGLDRNNKTPCGFCFVTYYTRRGALAAVKYLNGTKLDNRQLRVDIDYGFEEGRQFGRGRSGGQVRDEFRTDYDADRGGFGRVVAQQLAGAQLAMWQEVQAGAMMGAGLMPGDDGGAVFFNQMQRELLGQAQPTEGGEAAAEAAAGEAAAAAAAGVNPRMRGREDDDDDADADRRRNKRRRVGSAAAAAAGAAGAEAPPEQEAEAVEPAIEDGAGDGDGDDEMREEGGGSSELQEDEQQQEPQEDEDDD